MITLSLSQYFRTEFSNEWAKKEDEKFILRKQNISPHLFDIILRFLYCGNIELKNLQGPDVLNLLIAVDELNIHSLITYIQEYLIEHQTEFLHQNPTAPLFELLLKRDDLNMDEIEIWDNLLKWCFTQQNVMNDPLKWSKDDIIKIERSLHRFIPLIRFYDIEPTEFFYKVYCYKDILPQDLIHDLLEFHIVPNKKHKTNIPPSRKQNLKLDSNLVEPNLISLFASWINRKESSYYDKKDIPYEFKLLYRSSRDGIDNKLFHRNCDDKGATIWIAKIKDSTKLIGGYNPLDWNGDCWKNTGDSFLFSFADWKNISNATTKLSYINSGKNHAIYCNNNYGPQMGDLSCANSNNWTYYGSLSYYPNSGIPNNITIENYEVFQVIKK
ncbi:BTB/POZ domain-containing protein [Rhizophagus irregularis DAOM 181602=DAOM 197198]|nr:BTB/POZ domain-containing protein [Rhizophagus irregularis DAOM 181602=DAOM 197198]